MDKNVCILLATYNGERFLEQQLQSLFNQNRKPNKILVSDDASTDSTWSILHSWQRKYPDLIEIYKNDSGIQGHLGNFSHLCELAKKTSANYFLFCDQDDVWLPNKIENLLTHCIELETQNNKAFPVLIHSDLVVVDSNLNTLDRSFFKYQTLPNPNTHTFPKMIIQNVVTGCATIINRSLLEIATPIPRQAVVHDWWFAIVAHLKGVTGFVDEPLIQYRQHDNNAIGAKRKRNILKHFYRAINHLRVSYAQANKTLELFKLSEGHNVNRFLFFHELNFDEQRTFVKQIANNPNCKIEQSIIYVALFVLAKLNNRNK